jgi:hypothetical protein
MCFALFFIYKSDAPRASLFNIDFIFLPEVRRYRSYREVKRCADACERYRQRNPAKPMAVANKRRERQEDSVNSRRKWQDKTNYRSAKDKDIPDSNHNRKHAEICKGDFNQRHSRPHSRPRDTRREHSHNQRGYREPLIGFRPFGFLNFHSKRLNYREVVYPACANSIFLASFQTFTYGI